VFVFVLFALFVARQSSGSRLTTAVTIRVWPSGRVWQAVRAPGADVTLPPLARRIVSLEKGIDPYRAGEPLRRPLADGRAPTHVISLSVPLSLFAALFPDRWRGPRAPSRVRGDMPYGRSNVLMARRSSMAR
jgi:hypothetical protein